MKNEKGEAAFDSADEVLAKRIINTTEKHGQEEDTADLNSASNCSFDDETGEPKKGRTFPWKAVIIAACAGIALLITGKLLSRRQK